MKVWLGIILFALLTINLSQLVLAAIKAGPATGFELRPSKIELTLSPGEQAQRELLVTNHTATAVKVGVGVEDFVAGQNPRDPVQLLDSEINPFSLRPFITLGLRSVILPPGRSANVPVFVSLASTTAPGGLYGAVILSFDPVGSPIGSSTSARS